jgi:hypothetical protein
MEADAVQKCCPPYDRAVERPTRYVASLEHVREVSLLGSADLRFWTDRMRSAAVAPLARDGCAEVMVVGASARFRGVPFTELSFTITVGDNAAFLVQAFNSVRFFAWSERVFFSTPYVHAGVEVSAGNRPSCVLRTGGCEAFEARMAAIPAKETLAGEVWKGEVYLPDREKMFHAVLAGDTRRRAFDPSDRLSMRGGSPIIRALVESDFVPREWIVRSDARHRKSKTCRRLE